VIPLAAGLVFLPVLPADARFPVPSEASIVFGTGAGLGTGSSEALVLLEKPVLPSVLMLRRIRKVTGLGWEDIARLFGVARSSVYNWIDGNAMTLSNLRQLERLDRFFNAYKVVGPLVLRKALLGKNGRDDLIGRLAKARYNQKFFKDIEGVLDKLPRYARSMPLPDDEVQRLKPIGVPLVTYREEEPILEFIPPRRPARQIRIPKARKV
jgi:transcriptional regulator with XRE-family HTH domain